MKKLLVISVFALISMFSFSQTTLVPYNNNFDLATDTLGWSHYAISGTDDWEIGTPSKYSFTNAYSSPNVWVTNLTGSYAPSSNRALETPFFNFIDTTIKLVFSFYQSRIANGSPSYKVEYKIGQSGLWQMLTNVSAPIKNWQSSTGFSGSFTPTYQYSAIGLAFLQGQDSVKFRFRFTSSSLANEAGWRIDNFSIDEEYFNLTPQMGAPILGVNKNFTNLTIESTLSFSNQWNAQYNIKTDFYISKDLTIDSSDIFLGSVNNNISNSITSWDNTFLMPSNIYAGSYYILYNVDVLNALNEANENDNISYTVLQVDSVFSMPYVCSFDSTTQYWNKGLYNNNSIWNRGNPNNWQIESARSGKNAWFNREQQTGYNNELESPFLDLSSTSNTFLCFWFKFSGQNGNPMTNIRFKFPSFGNTIISQPYYPTSNETILPNPRLYGWDCFCKNLSDYDGETSTKFKFSGYGGSAPSQLGQYAIDDIYIGEPKPDVAIEGEKKFRFTSSNILVDTLKYLVFNSGISTLNNTTTEFYWSTDSVLDIGDILLGNNTEPMIPDTSFEWSQFTYLKPTLNPGKYYIIFKADALEQIDEMREYDNLGYFEIYQDEYQPLPYYNDFESDISGWRHSATLGEDEWVWGTPQSTNINSAFSGTKAFVTNDTGIVSFKSRMHLFTPIFNLAELQTPVLEFDMLAHFYWVNNYNSWPFNMGNIMFSINGGATWNILDTTNSSYKKMYCKLELEQIGGEDRIQTVGSSTGVGEILYGNNLKMFRTQNEYQGRDYDDNHHYVIDLSFLQQYNQVQFMFVYANHDAPVDGMMIDNFQIREGEIDLMMPEHKKLMVSSNDKYFKQNFKIKNNNNYISNSTLTSIFCSSDSILDASDFPLVSYTIPAIQPFANYLLKVNQPTPTNYGSYNYLIVKVDTNNLNIESNEINNTHIFEFNMDTASNFIYPVLFDFNDDEINGWVWYHDYTGYRHGHRFRHKTVIGEPAINAQSGEWFLDPIDLAGFSSSIAGYPNYFLETPPFNFSNLTNILLEFDFLCSGRSGSSNTQGGNMQYSIDGGITWIILTKVQDPNAINWYNLNAVESLNNEPGWGYWGNWSSASYNLSFLSGISSVRFRYKFRSKYSPNSLYLPNGFRLDNFKISGDLNTSIEDVLSTQGFVVNYFPNPTNGSTTVLLREISKETLVSVRNIVGQDVFSGYFFNTKSLNFEINGPSGFYTIEIRTKEGKTASLKALKK